MDEFPDPYVGVKCFFSRRKSHIHRLAEDGTSRRNALRRGSRVSTPLTESWNAFSPHFEVDAQRFAIYGAVLATNLAGDAGVNPYEYGVQYERVWRERGRGHDAREL